MSEETDRPENDTTAESEPERKFSREQYERLMAGQSRWIEFEHTWKSGGDPWTAFQKETPGDVKWIVAAIEAWNADPPAPALLEKADFRGAFLEGVNLNGAYLGEVRGHRARLDEATLMSAHLEGALLLGTHLKRANLRRAHLEGANLHEAHLEGVDLLEAHLEGATAVGVHLDAAMLKGAHLQGADLRGAHLEGANLGEARLHGSHLGGARLTSPDVIDLTAGQLAGADVTSAKLPEDIQDFESLKVADEAAKNSRSLFLVMLLACVYSWLTLATTTDQALIMDTGSSPLPIIRVPVPIRGFFLAAPAFLLAAYAYFHLYLHGLWSRLAKLPAVFPDGRPLDERAYPWLLTSLVRPHFERLKKERPAFSKAKVGLAILLAWWVVPVTIYLFWAQALAAHLWYMTVIHHALFLASLGVGVMTYRIMVSTLRLEDPPPPKARDVVRQVAAAGSGRIPVATALMVLLSALALWGPRRLPSVPLLLRPYANLTNAELSTHPVQSFAGDSGIVVPAALAGRNLRFANMTNAHLERADLWGANLGGAVLVEADLGGAVLEEAVLVGAVLVGADIIRANLSWADLTGANLGRADLSGANLQGAVLDSADFTSANLTGADLNRADLTGADLLFAVLDSAGLFLADLSGVELRGANFGGADLRGADLIGADLFGAELNGANLTSADLTGADLNSADLSHADLTHADLSHANLTGANLTGAILRNANLRTANLLGVDLSEADLSIADLSWADLSTAIVLGAKSLDAADLENTNVWSVRGAPSSFWPLAARAGAICRDPSTGERVPVSFLIEGWDGEEAPPGCGP